MPGASEYVRGRESAGSSLLPVMHRARLTRAREASRTWEGDMSSREERLLGFSLLILATICWTLAAQVLTLAAQ